ncbi:hypothetical protein LX36DRAFT_732408 [Colletotrichum falcatum]|nr:hypothetical protein LX36DRAFT_732408 [Colletotrichum falcatum]
METPSDLCKILCLNPQGYEPMQCRKGGRHQSLSQRIEARFDHIRAVRGQDAGQLRRINSLHRWLFPNGVFQNQNFQEALRRSEPCDWSCCTGTGVDQNTYAGLRTASRTWNVSNDELTTFFGAKVTGNTWREIALFSKKAPKWKYARPALREGKRKRMDNDPSMTRRISLSKEWTPYDMKLALPIYHKELALRNSEVNQGGDANHGVAFDGPETVGDVDTARTETPVEMASPVTVHTEPNDITVVFSSAVANSPSFTSKDRGAKRSRSPDTAQHPTPKRLNFRRPANSEVGTLLSKEALSPLESGFGLSREVIHAALYIIECAVGSRLAIVDPTTPRAFRECIGEPGTQHLIPVSHKDHWLLGVMGVNRDVLLVYDPQPSSENRRVVMEKVASSISPTPKVKFDSPLLQDKEEDSGLLLIASAFYVSASLEVPQDADPTFWRSMVRMLLAPSSEDEASVVQTYRTGQPLLPRCDPEQAAVAGGDIDIGQVAPCLTPTKALGLCRKLRSEAFAARRRVKLAASSASSLLGAVAALERRGRIRCQQGAGADIVESLVRSAPPSVCHCPNF